MIAVERMVLIPLIAIGALGALILGGAWRSFRQIGHALTWSAAFALLSAMWLLRLTAPAASIQPLLLPLLGGAAVTLGTIGFRQRAHLPAWAARLWLGWLVEVGISWGVTRIPGGWPFVCVPFHLHALAMILISTSTLTGRRRSERAAERGATIALAAAAVWIGARLISALVLDAPLKANLRYGATVAQPAIVTAVSLFVIFLIGADLADRLRRLASTDRLTGLLNRRGLEEALGSIMASARRNRRSIVLALADIDHFKKINDRFGHPAGDRVIQAVGQCLAGNVSRRDLVSRFGGEEFAVVMTDVDSEVALCAAEVLREKLAGLCVDKGISCTVSFGLAVMSPQETSQTDFVARADRALYQSKTRGRNRVTLAD